MPETKETHQSIYEDLKKSFVNEEGEKVWSEIQGIATDTLKDLAKAKFYSLMGTEADKILARSASAMITDSLKQLTQASADKTVNYALERLESFVSKFVFRELLKLLV
ncbi:hypothetical protein [Candidatus Uabimicrobium sp. HlEnr_7]|uniref:hypothetical protein n=1 Tax=Candidatus Uabimicrobium helgolandensis TaxID=3095367 RepID=UPI00355864E2